MAEAFGCKVEVLPEVIEGWLASVGIDAFLDRYVSATAADGLSDNLITRSRAANNLRPADGAAARRIAQRALRRFCRSEPQLMVGDEH